jgi:hypothetical protein
MAARPPDVREQQQAPSVRERAGIAQETILGRLTRMIAAVGHAGDRLEVGKGVEKLGPHAVE